MDNDTIFKILAVVSPVVSGGITYLLTQRSKKIEYLYQYRIPAFKEVFNSLVIIKRFAIGKISLEQGNEFSPFFDEDGSPLELRTTLAKAREANDIFLTKKSRKSLDDIDITLGILCNAFIAHKDAEGNERYTIDYEPLLKQADKAQEILYDGMGLPNS